MIYRIRIMKQVDGALVFDRYADSEDYRELKVNPEGKVFYHNVYSYLRNPETGEMGYEQYEKDVSDTHFVEWGLQSGVFENNLYKCIKSVSSYSPQGTIFIVNFDETLGEFYFSNDYDMVRLSSIANDANCYFEHIGNVWENPEMVEAQQ